MSFFSGAGGLDLGFHQAGFETIYAADNNENAVETFNANTGFRNIARIQDLSSVDVQEIIDNIEARGIVPIGAIGGPPCQGFSRGNCKSYTDDPRNKLPIKYSELISALKKNFNIDFFVFENVMGIRDARHASTFEDLKNSFINSGFILFEGVVDASRFGIPQIRRRLILVGINQRKYPDIVLNFPKGRKCSLTVRDVIGHLPEPVFFSKNLSPDKIPFHKNHWTMVPRSEKFLKKVFIGRSFRQLDWSKKSPTVAYGHREIHVHPNGRRRLSIYEAMLLQGFPSNYWLTGNLSSQVDQVSNAVPPPVAKALASSIKKAIYTQ